MKKNTLIVLICVLFLQGCASLYGTPEERIALNKTLPDYTLCEKLAIATLAPETIRTEWAMELQNRGKDCNAHAAAIAAQRMQNSADLAALLNYSGQMLNSSQPMYMPPQMPTERIAVRLGARIVALHGNSHKPTLTRFGGFFIACYFRNETQCD